MTDALSGRVWVAAGKTTSTVQSEVVVPLAVTTLGKLKTTAAAGGGSTQVSVQNVAGTTLLTQFTTASAAQVEPKAGAVFGISGNTTVVQGTSPWAIGGNTTAIISTASRIQAQVDALTTASVIQVEPKAAAVFGISGNTTAIISTASRIQAQVDPLTTASKIQVEAPAGLAVSGNTTAIITTASKIQVEAPAALPISGNATALITTASTINVSPQAGSTFLVRRSMDNGSRIPVTLYGWALAPTSAITPVSLERTTAYTSVAAATTYNVAANRILRIQHIDMSITQTTNVSMGCWADLHASSLSGVAVTSASPIVWTAFVVPATTNINAGAMAAMDFSDGLDIAGGSSGRDLMVTLITGTSARGTAGTTNVRVNLTLTGYEYTT